MKSNGHIDEAKRVLRLEMRRRMASHTPEERAEGSHAICRRLLLDGEWRGAGVVMGYLSLPSEPEVVPVLREAADAGRVVAVPRWNPTLGEYDAARWTPDARWAMGPDGVAEPAGEAESVALERLDLILIPGLAFDTNGRRLGRGKGYFDRLLSRARRARRWGVGFDWQLVAEVPSAPHDANLDLLVTPGYRLAVSTRGAH